MSLSALASPFVLRELLRPSFGRRARVGWVLPKLWSYGGADASTRLRAYDLWRPLNELGVEAELYRSFLGYRAVVFQKAFGPEHLALARKLKAEGVRIVLDVNVNYLSPDPEFVPQARRDELEAMLPLADAVVAASPWLAKAYAARAPRVYMVPDPVRLGDFPELKRHSGTRGLRLLYCGYAVKAKELLGVMPALRAFRLLLVCERDPVLPGVAYDFVRFSRRGLAAAFAAADIKVAPRDLSRPYNLGHSSLKIALPMAAGLPVVASAVPSYEETPAVICRELSEWEARLGELAGSPELRDRLGGAGREWVARELDLPVVAARYAAALREVLA